MEKARFPGFALRHAANMWNLLDLSNPEISYKPPLQLNETGAYIWKKINSGYSEEELIDWLASEYEVDREIAATDVKEFVEKLKAYGVPFED